MWNSTLIVNIESIQQLPAFDLLFLTRKNVWSSTAPLAFFENWLLCLFTGNKYTILTHLHKNLEPRQHKTQMQNSKSVFEWPLCLMCPQKPTNKWKLFQGCQVSLTSLERINQDATERGSILIGKYKTKSTLQKAG